MAVAENAEQALELGSLAVRERCARKRHTAAEGCATMASGPRSSGWWPPSWSAALSGSRAHHPRGFRGACHAFPQGLSPNGWEW